MSKKQRNATSILWICLSLCLSMSLVAGCSVIVGPDLPEGNCGDERCDPAETANNCPTDCDPSNCGDEECQLNENARICPGDCWYLQVCGNNVCELDEEAQDCPDCLFSTETCPNGQCDDFENGAVCPEDCNDSPYCGNRVVDSGEECDQPDAVTSTSCETLGFGPGELTCSTACVIDTSGCGPQEFCGNGEIDPGEYCDGADVGLFPDCGHLGFQSGTPTACTESCEYDASVCTPIQPQGSANGEDCVDENSCEGDICLRAAPLTHGYCSHRCAHGVCPGGGLCFENGPAGEVGPLCYQGCYPGDTCANPALTCYDPDGLIGMPICWP